jgi:transporter family protein
MPQPWLTYAILSALAASLIPILGKVGMKGIDSNLATGVRSVAQMLFVLGVCTIMGLWSKLPSFNKTAWLMTALAGIAGGASWLFYFKAIQLGQVSKVAPLDKLSMPLSIVLAALILRDTPRAVNWVGDGMNAVGAYLATK